MMKTIASGIVALAALMAIAPASAQYNHMSDPAVHERGGGIAARIERMDARLETAIRDGDISRRDARPLLRELRSLARLERRYSRDGLSQYERAELQQRIRDLRQRFRAADINSRGGYDAGGRGNGAYDGRRAEGRIDRNNDGWDDRDADRDGKWTDDVQAAPYEDSTPRTGLGGLFDSIFGNDRE